MYHIVWTPKYRRGLLINNIKVRLEKIIKEVCLEHGCQIKALEILPDHIHVFLTYSPAYPPNKIVKIMKGRSSNILRKEFPELLKMETLWTRSYFICTVGNASAATIQKYINDQWKK